MACYPCSAARLCRPKTCNTDKLPQLLTGGITEVNVMKYHVTQISGSVLNTAVEIALGAVRVGHRVDFPCGYWCVGSFNPSSSWTTGGDLIAKHIKTLQRADGALWWAHSKNCLAFGETALIAAMRAIVAEHLGDEFDLNALSGSVIGGDV